MATTKKSKSLVVVAATDPVAIEARKALHRIGSLSTQIDRALKQIPACREAWRDYGTALLAGRAQHASHKSFGAWVKANKLDTGSASSPVVRSDAIWLAEHWDAVLSTLKTSNNHRPDHLHQEYRNALKREKEKAKGYFIDDQFNVGDLNFPDGLDPKDWAYARQTAKLLSRIAQDLSALDLQQVERGLLRDELSAIARPTMALYEFLEQLRTHINNVRFGIPKIPALPAPTGAATETLQ